MTINKKGRIIQVMHRLPIEQSSLTEWTSRHGHAAMYSGIESLKDEWDILYIGWTGHLSNENEQVVYEQLDKYNCIPVFLDQESINGHYKGYCKTLLWPLFHHIIWNDATDGRIERAQWNHYVNVNQKYVDLVIKHYKPEDTIWIHDYHLLLVPQMLRRKLPRARIGLFVHSPFPSSEIFRCLPKRQEILKGMLSANMIGFQTYGNARHFISTSTRVLGYEATPDGVEYEGHFCHIGTFPIGIDTDAVEKIRQNPEVTLKIGAIQEIYSDKKIVVARDKIDLIQGVLQKLAAFEKFLVDYPMWRNKVVLIQVTDDSCIEAKNENKIAEMVAHINGSYGSLEFTPVLHYHHQMQMDEYYALLSIADAAFITSVRDGMNTASLEYVMCQQKKHGALIVSELTGTAGSMGSALLVNPWDYSGVARAFHEALTMPEEEKMTRHLQLLAHVKSNTSSFWANAFIKELVRACLLSEQSNYTPLIPLDYLKDKYKKSKRRLLCFDYDGTLIPIKKWSSASTPTKEILKYMKIMCQDEQNEVWINSGRDEGTLSHWLGHIKNLGLSAEHGSFLRYPNATKWINLTQNLDMTWKNAVLEIFTYYTERTTGSFIEHKRGSLTWHYRLADPEYGAFQAKECQNHLEQAILSKLPIEVIVGKKNIQVRPAAINKGQVLKRLLVSAGSEPFDFVLCCGDDKMDEDMFKILAKSTVLKQSQIVSIRVGDENEKTSASWHLPTVDHVIDALKVLVAE
ncbi:glycosyltransferase family 20 protein [Backusella circina FSU 941]|nr:glycosyltransferase family 20 protein [Backusella circina FSU 941]